MSCHVDQILGIGLFLSSALLIKIILTKEKPEIKVKEIIIYPIKSCRGFSRSSWHFTQTGFLYDRHFMLVDVATKKFVSQRSYPMMSLIQTQIDENLMTVSVPSKYGMSDLKINLEPTNSDNNSRLNVSVWGDECEAIDLGDTCANWFNKFLSENCPNSNSSVRFVRFSNARIRKTDPKYGIWRI